MSRRPRVPQDRWNARITDAGGDMYAGTAWVEITLDSVGGTQAASRTLAFLAADFTYDVSAARVDDVTTKPSGDRRTMRVYFAQQ